MVLKKVLHLLRGRKMVNSMEKLSAKDVAKVFVQLANSLPGDSIDNMKLNKLCYYAQGWMLARYNTTLFDEPIEAWDYGPVVPTVYRAYSRYERNPIPDPKKPFDERTLSGEELELITDVYMAYGKYSSLGLMNLTHKKGTPWDTVYEQGANNRIGEDLLRKYFNDSEPPIDITPILNEDTVEPYA